jgi:hypothetical protein
MAQEASWVHPDNGELKALGVGIAAIVLKSGLAGAGWSPTRAGRAGTQQLPQFNVISHSAFTRPSVLDNQALLTGNGGPVT